MPSHLKLVVEKHPDGYVAYPLGIGRGAILGQGDTYEESLADVRSAIAFHVETFGGESLARSFRSRSYSLSLNSRFAPEHGQVSSRRSS